MGGEVDASANMVKFQPDRYNIKYTMFARPGEGMYISPNLSSLCSICVDALFNFFDWPSFHQIKTLTVLILPDAPNRLL